ncbi:hypothetical protein MANES_11G107750v8 [Manihot esculenta]|uniref:Uncharacterized protein n=1 Tax=Manihot esculenta TaxID=3983 RepID=A0ACB7GUZ1_MANES|nr:hypothetical protein MANES_11G107750v8 [Manihot esculenta]
MAILELSSSRSFSLRVFKLKVGILSLVVPLSFPWVEKIVSRVTPSSLSEAIPQFFLSIETHYIRTLNFNEQIPLFSFPPPYDLVDAQFERRLVFYLKQVNYGLSFPFFGFFTLFSNFSRSPLGY